MNKFTYALALGAGLLFGLATPNASADAMVQNLSPGTLSAAQFNADFAPTTGVLTSPYTFLNTPTSGVVESQVFQGQGAYSGLTAYAYQFGVKDVTDNTGQATSVNSASMQFDATPTPANLIGGPGATTTANSSVYVVTDGQVGGINLPVAAPGTHIQVPTSIAWQPGGASGSLTFQYLDAKSNTGPLQAGATSGTIVVITDDPKTTLPFVSIQNADPQVGYPQAYAPTGGKIDQVPAPEPATIIGWTSIVGALALVRRVRRSRLAA